VREQAGARSTLTSRLSSAQAAQVMQAKPRSGGPPMIAHEQEVLAFWFCHTRSLVEEQRRPRPRRVARGPRPYELIAMSVAAVAKESVGAQA
jgi:hypothetical protein